MTLGVNVAGGTNAGTRRPPAPPARDWIHLCRERQVDGIPTSVVLSGYFRNCPACYCPRPITSAG